MKYIDFIDIENLFQAWNEFKKGKINRADVQRFQINLEDNLFNLHYRLLNKTYAHGHYYSFFVNDPKQRHIHKANVGDRVVHHLLYTYLYKIFDPSFIYDSYSCRLNKGTHKGVIRLGKFTRIVSKNYSNECWALKLDIKKFFASIDHKILLNILKGKIIDKDIIWLLTKILDSFNSEQGYGKGIPLGNLTSQVFANIYMNKLDQYIKHILKIKYYIRYADDFIILSPNKNDLLLLINQIAEFIKDNLKLELHQNKIIIRKLDWGIDFLGYIVLPHYCLPRTRTKKRIFIKLKEKIDSPTFNSSLQSYLGYLKHANTHNLTQYLKNQIWIWRKMKNTD